MPRWHYTVHPESVIPFCPSFRDLEAVYRMTPQQKYQQDLQRPGFVADPAQATAPATIYAPEGSPCIRNANLGDHVEQRELHLPQRLQAALEVFGRRHFVKKRAWQGFARIDEG